MSSVQGHQLTKKLQNVMKELNSVRSYLEIIDNLGLKNNY